MANESVNRPIPGVDDILNWGFDGRNRYEDPGRIAQAADNVLTTLHAGVMAIGELLANAGSNTENPIDHEVLSRTGFLLTELGALIRSLDTIKENANYQGFDVRADWLRDGKPAQVPAN